jgi:hypothetical protein
MQVRMLSVWIGTVVRTVDAYPYSLPKGLPGGVEVIVMKPCAKFEHPSFDRPK